MSNVSKAHHAAPQTHGTPPPPSASGGRCVVVLGSKGGVGKTMVAVNLAIALAKESGARVGLIDLDAVAVGDMAQMLAVKPEHTLVDAAGRPPDSLTGRAERLHQMMHQHPKGVRFLPAARTPDQFRSLSPRWLGAALKQLADGLDYLIIDGGRTLTEHVVAALERAHLVLIVLTPDIVALNQAKWTLEALNRLLFPRQLFKVVLNRAGSLGSVPTPDVLEALECEIVAELPSEGRVVGTSISQGLPLVLSFPTSRVALACRELGRKLLQDDKLYLERQARPTQRDEAVPLTMSDLWSSRLPQALPASASATTSKDDELIRIKQSVHQQVVERLDLKKMSLMAWSDPRQLQRLRQLVEQMSVDLLTQAFQGQVPSYPVRAKLVKEIVDEALGLGPLEELLADPAVTDILVNNKDQIYVERHGKLQLTGQRFVSDDQVRTVIERIVAPLGRRIDESNPMVDARLPDGSRVNAIIPPLSIKGPSLSIRKFARERLDSQELIRRGTLTAAMGSLLQACVVARKNVVISGGTGSGKTTLLNVLSAFIPSTERILTIEDAVELQLAQTHWVSLEARPPNVEGKGEVTPRDLFRNALRMRPDRIIIGECRGEETLDMLQAMNTGHDGSMTTVHANSPRDIIPRIDSMVLMSRVDLPIRAIREMIASAIHLVVHTSRLADGSRRIMAISEIVGIANGLDVLFQDLFQFQQLGQTPEGAVTGEFVATGHRPTFLHELTVKGIPLDERIFQPGEPQSAAP